MVGVGRRIEPNDARERIAHLAGNVFDTFAELSARGPYQEVMERDAGNYTTASTRELIVQSGGTGIRSSSERFSTDRFNDDPGFWLPRPVGAIGLAGYEADGVPGAQGETRGTDTDLVRLADSLPNQFSVIRKTRTVAQLGTITSELSARLLIGREASLTFSQPSGSTAGERQVRSTCRTGAEMTIFDLEGRLSIFATFGDYQFNEPMFRKPGENTPMLPVIREVLGPEYMEDLALRRSRALFGERRIGRRRLKPTDESLASIGRTAEALATLQARK